MTTKQYIISFCNNKLNDGSNGLLGLVTYDAKLPELSFKHIALQGVEQHQPRGITGLCQHGSGYVALLQAKAPQLLFLNQAFELTGKWNLSQYKGIHTIQSDGDNVYFSVTGQDLICRSNDGINFEILWETGQNLDSIHLNSICFFQGRLHFTAFGPKAEQNLWSSAKNGVVQSIDKSTPIKNAIWHPHSLFALNQDLYFCHSSQQRVETLDQVVVEKLPGYTRGLHVTNNHLVCGTSKGRLVSHSTGVQISNISDQGSLAGSCGVWLKDFMRDAQHYLNLDEYATEVFEVIQVI